MLTGPVSISEWPPCTEPAMLQGLLQDILHALPAPLHCGRTKVFMTDSTVSGAGVRSWWPRARVEDGEHRRPRTSADTLPPAGAPGAQACPGAGAVCPPHPAWLEETPVPHAGQAEAGSCAHPGR